ncbi:MAG: FprA family A-type flavoprotein [Bacteroidales bacterium]|nr:FprA family A-type flavoprotein [Bacteroidales bacterium]
MKQTKISDRIYYVGTNDRKKSLFENNWPLPNGISYNSFLIADLKSALIDTLEYGSKSDYIITINEILNGKSLDYLIINHLEPDHASMIGEVINCYPDVKIVANRQCMRLLSSYYTISENQLLEITEGDVLDLGYHKLSFIMIPWVHWPETMVTYDATERILFTCDAFGSFGTLDGGIFDDEVNFERYYEDEMRRYYSNIVGKYSNFVQRAFEKLSVVPIKMICPSHGVIWREDAAKVMSLYKKWSYNKSEKGVVIAYASMYGNTEKMADYLARCIAEEGIKNIKIFDVSKTHPSYIISEIWRYEGLILGTCAYNGEMHPQMGLLCNELLICAPKNKKFAIFGSSTWNGAGVKALISFAQKSEWQPVTEPVQMIGAATNEKMAELKQLAIKIAEQIK